MTSARVYAQSITGVRRAREGVNGDQLVFAAKLSSRNKAACYVCALDR